jgi:hypothetical protein
MQGVRALASATAIITLTSPADARVAEWTNKCDRSVYVHIEFPDGGMINFRLRPGDSHKVNIRDHDVRWCWDEDGSIGRCREPLPVDEDGVERIAQRYCD